MAGESSVDRDADRLLADHTPDVQAIARRLRVLVREELPEVDEQVDFGNRLVAFGRSMRMTDLLFAVIPHRRHVNLQLATGAELADPTGIVEGTGKRIRHVKCRSLEDVDRPAVRELVRAQIAR
jgi:hypothetical protein